MVLLTYFGQCVCAGCVKLSCVCCLVRLQCVCRKNDVALIAQDDPLHCIINSRPILVSVRVLAVLNDVAPQGTR